MGWAKYAEDNYNIYLEREAIKDSIFQPAVYSNYEVNTIKKTQIKKESNFAEMFAGESCFSL